MAILKHTCENDNCGWLIMPDVKNFDVDIDVSIEAKASIDLNMFDKNRKKHRF